MADLGEDESIRDLSETLDTELKFWIHLEDDREAALLARAALALRNNNGGQIVLGIDDKTCRSIEPPANIGDIRETYHADKLNEMVGKYAATKFELRVDYKEYEGRLHPRIIIAGGIVAPVLTRRGFPGLLRQNAVYVRTVSNGRVSSCEPVTSADWEKLINVCFDNREADVGRFLRRHLPAISEHLGLNKPLSPKPTPIDLAQQFLDIGRKRLEESEGSGQ